MPSKKSTTSDHKNHNNNIKNHNHIKEPIKRRHPNDEDHQCKEKRQRKKAIIEGPDPLPEMPRWPRDGVEEKGGGGYGERLLIQKGLTMTDVVGGQNRISMPVRQQRSPDDFRTEDELRNVLRRKDNDEKHFKGLSVTFVEPYSRTSELSLRKWEYHHEEWTRCLKVGDIIQIVSLGAMMEVHALPSSTSPLKQLLFSFFPCPRSRNSPYNQHRCT